MKYSQLISFNPITTVIQLTDANIQTEEEKLALLDSRLGDIGLG